MPVTAPEIFEVHDILVAVTRKPIKNLYFRVDISDGRARASVPLRLSDRDVRKAIEAHLQWIRNRQAKVLHRQPALVLQFQTGEQHPVFGRLYPLEVRLVASGRSAVKLTADGTLLMCVRPGLDREGREALLERWLRSQMHECISALITKWQPAMGVSVREYRIKRMRTRWGTCNIGARRIWLNLELARRPESCLEYVVVHEMVHLLEAGHNRRFYTLMDRFLPEWKQVRSLLNSGRSTEID